MQHPRNLNVPEFLSRPKAEANGVLDRPLGQLQCNLEICERPGTVVIDTRASKNRIRVAPRHHNVVLISSLGSRENIVGVSDFSSRVDKQTALNRSRLNSSEQGSSVSPRDSCSGNIGAFRAGEVTESRTANQIG